ncbi:MAG TPA: glycosyltransferase 87 family protein, partial [Propionibacteriaceae bacterium]|nr:glycosyltransferase 87 family protein [Propionibacteriaceae bacterium]
NGNIFIPLAAMCVLGFRYPRVWAFSPLTKVAPTVMPIWWLARREWRPLASWAVTTLAVVVVSAAVAPDLWKQCVAHMAQWATESGATIGFPLMGPLLYRAPVGLALIVTGALKGWLWTVPVAALLLTPVFWLGGLAWLAAIPRIQREERRGMNRPVRLDAGDWWTQREESNETDLNKARNDLSPQ